MANAIRQEIDSPNINFQGVMKNSDGSHTHMSGDHVFNTTDVSNFDVSTNDIYVMVSPVYVTMELGNYPEDISLSSYAGYVNNNAASGFNRVGINNVDQNHANILFRLDGRLPAPNFGNVYFKQFTLALPGYTQTSANEEVYIVSGDTELSAITQWAGQTSPMEFVKFRLITSL